MPRRRMGYRCQNTPRAASPHISRPLADSVLTQRRKGQRHSAIRWHPRRTPAPPPCPAPQWDAPPGSPHPRGMAARTCPAPRRDALHAARPPAPGRSRFVNAKHVGHVSGVPAAVPGVPHEETPSVGRMTPRRPRAPEGRATSSHASCLTSHDFHVLRFALKRFTLYASKRPCALFDEKGGFPLYLFSADQMQS